MTYICQIFHDEHFVDITAILMLEMNSCISKTLIPTLSDIKCTGSGIYKSLQEGKYFRD